MSPALFSVETPCNTDTEETEQSVRIREVSV